MTLHHPACPKHRGQSYCMCHPLRDRDNRAYLAGGPEPAPFIHLVKEQPSMRETATNPATGIAYIRPTEWPLPNDSREQAEWTAAVRAFDVDPHDLTLAGRPPQISIHDLADHATLDADVFDCDAAGRRRLAEEHLSIAIRSVRISTTAKAVREAIAHA